MRLTNRNVMTRGGSDTQVFTCKSQPSGPKCPVLPTEPLVHEHVELSRLAPWTHMVEPADGPDTICETAFKAVVGERRSLLLTGLAGTGKTHLAKALVSKLREQGEQVHLISLCHVGACVLGGCTIHNCFTSFYGLATSEKGGW